MSNLEEIENRMNQNKCALKGQINIEVVSTIYDNPELLGGE